MEYQAFRSIVVCGLVKPICCFGVERDESSVGVKLCSLLHGRRTFGCCCLVGGVTDDLSLAGGEPV